MLASIAFEEIANAHILNAEGEKLQTLGTLVQQGQVTMDDVLALQNSVSRMLRVEIKKEMLLQFKLEDVIELIRRFRRIHLNVATVTATIDGVTVTDTDNAYYHTGETTTLAAAREPKVHLTEPAQNPVVQAVVGPVDLGHLTDYLLVFTDGRTDANWQGASKGFVGDVAVDGLQAAERTSGFVPYAGTIFTNAPTLGPWQQIVNDNPGQANGVTGQVALINMLTSDLVSAFQQINALPATPGFESRSSGSLNGLNTQNGINETFVINITSGLNFSDKIYITGDPGDVFILRWDTDANPNNGYQGQVKPQSGGAIVPLGGLTPTNFINVAGDINSSGGGTNPLPPYPQGPRYNDGQGPLINGGSDFNGGGFFTGYWLTTGSPDNFDPATGLYYGETSPLSNGIFVGGWYTITTKFSMTSGTSGVYVKPNPATEGLPSIDVEKLVSPDNGVTWLDADEAPGPTINPGTNPQFRFIVTNTTNVTLTNVTVTDNVYGLIGTIPSLLPDDSFEWTITVPWTPGQHENMATATGTYNNVTVSDTDLAHYVGAAPAIDVEKLVSPDNGVTWLDADTPTGPIIPAGTNPQFKFVVTNTGNVTLTNVVVTDDVFGPIGTLPSLAPGASFSWTIIVPWQAGQHVNTATATGQYDGLTLTDTDPAYYLGVEIAIDVEKLVSPDNGVTWLDADTPTGPVIPSGTNPQFRFIVTNTGNQTLTNVVVDDSVYGLIGTLPSLAPGASFTWTIIVPWQAGQHMNTATATGQFNGQTVIDTDPAYYFGEQAGGAIDVEKLVSPDNGLTWLDADVPPGPDIPIGTNPQFMFIVTNTGTVTLNNVTITDDIYGFIGLVPSLAPGASASFTIIRPWQPGQHINVATAVGTFDGQSVMDTDPANYVGVEGAISILKQVSPDNGVTWFDADVAPGPIIPQGTNPQFRFIVTNTGAVTLNNVTVTDDVYGPIGTIPTLAPGASFTFNITVPWQLGQHTDIATATGTFDSQSVTDTNPANYLGVIGTIDVEKLVSPDNGATWLDADVAPGPTIVQGTNPQFKFVVTNTGTIALNNVVVTDDVFGLIGTLPTLAPGASFEWTIITLWELGQHTNTATATAEYDGHMVTDSDPANYLGVTGPSIMITKLVSVDNGLTFQDANTPPGPLLPPGVQPQFRYVVTNNGSVTLTNITVTDSVLGLIGTIPQLLPGESFTFTVVG